MTRKQTALAQWPPAPANPKVWMIDSDELVEGQEWWGVHTLVGSSINHPPIRRPVWVADLLDLPEPPRPTVTVDLDDLEWLLSRTLAPIGSGDIGASMREACRQAREALEMKGGES